MYVCIYVFMYLCMYLCMHVYMYVYMLIHNYVHIVVEGGRGSNRLFIFIIFWRNSLVSRIWLGIWLGRCLILYCTNLESGWTGVLVTDNSNIIGQGAGLWVLNNGLTFPCFVSPISRMYVHTTYICIYIYSN